MNDLEVNQMTTGELKSSIIDRRKIKLDKLKERYKIHENLIIARSARKSIRYIEKNIVNFPKEYSVLKSRIINTLYDMLECIYRANIMQDIEDKKEIIVCIEMLNFYLECAFKEKLISYKKFESYISHLIEIDSMTRSWFKYETSK